MELSLRSAFLERLFPIREIFLEGGLTLRVSFSRTEGGSVRKHPREDYPGFFRGFIYNYELPRNKKSVVLMNVSFLSMRQKQSNVTINSIVVGTIFLVSGSFAAQPFGS